MPNSALLKAADASCRTPAFNTKSDPRLLRVFGSSGWIEKAGGSRNSEMPPRANARKGVVAL